jgi:hypothetical protein
MIVDAKNQTERKLAEQFIAKPTATAEITTDHVEFVVLSPRSH